MDRPAQGELPRLRRLTRKRRSGARTAVVGLLVGVLAGCGQGQSTVPPGAQLVHLVATGSEVRLDPPSVRAGDVYLQLDEPLDGGSFIFVERMSTEEETPGPLTDNDLERLAHGDTQGTSSSAYGPSCGGPQGAARGHLVAPGVCGNVWKFVLVPGKYAILGPAWTEQQTEPSVDPTADPAGFIPPPTMTVLEVLP
jgi:hypothetical protein